jgi:hypothetical protein
MFKRTRGSQEPVSLNWFIWATKKTRTAYGKHVGGQSAQNEKDLLKTSHASIVKSPCFLQVWRAPPVALSAAPEFIEKSLSCL